jgi:uncharacterized membrane protein
VKSSLKRAAFLFIPIFGSMKNLSILFILLIGSFAFGQNVNFLSKESFGRIDASKLQYINASKDKEIVWEEGKEYLIDFMTSDDLNNVDSVVVKIGASTFSNSFLTPVYLSEVAAESKIAIQAYKGGNEVGFKSMDSQGIEISFHEEHKPMILKDTIVFGILAILLGFVFYTSASKNAFWTKFYRVVPALLLCYLLPAILNAMGLISGEYSGLYTMAKNYLLPGALILMTLGIDFKGLINLGPKALIMFFTATVGIMIGGPIAILIYKNIDPAVVGGEGFDAAWRGMATLAGSWIGGGANQAAMLETFEYNQDLYGKMVTVDIVVANIWMAFLLWAATRSDKFDKWLKADSSSITELKNRMVNYQSSTNRIPTLTELMVILGITFGIVGIAHFFGGDLATAFESAYGEDSPFASSFFWIVVLATTGGLLMSLTKMRKYEGAGASKIGSVFIYILVATIGMHMDLAEALKEPQLLLVGIIWMAVHVGLLFLVAKLIKAPFFFVAVGSKANVGGAASAPVIASAFHPSLASVGAILAVLGYALGTYGALAAAYMMEWASK